MTKTFFPIILKSALHLTKSYIIMNVIFFIIEGWRMCFPPLHYFPALIPTILLTQNEFLDSSFNSPSLLFLSHVRSIIDHLPLRKDLGVSYLTAKVLRQLHRKAIVFLYNSILRTTNFPLLWKFSVMANHISFSFNSLPVILFGHLHSGE